MAFLERLIYLAKPTEINFPSHSGLSHYEEFTSGKIRGILFAWAIFLVVLFVFLIVVIRSLHYSQMATVIAEPVDNFTGSANIQIENLPDSISAGSIVAVTASKDHMAFEYAADTADTQTFIYHYRVIEKSITAP